MPADGQCGRAGVDGQGLVDQCRQPVGGGGRFVRPPAAARPDVVGDRVRADEGAEMGLGATHVDADHER